MARKKKEVQEQIIEQQQDSLLFLKSYLEVQNDEYIYELTFNDKIIEIKQYLDIISKVTLVDMVVASSIILDEDTGIKKLNRGYQEMMFDYLLIKNYTNLDLTNDYTEVYDLFKKSGLLDLIIENIPDDEIDMLYFLVDEAIQNELDAIEKENTFTNVVSKLIKQFSEMDFEKITEQLEGLKNSEIIRGMMDGKLQ